MAIELKVNPANTAELLVKDGAAEYALNAQGQLHAVTSAGDIAPKLSATENKVLLDKALKHIEAEGAKLPNDVKELLPNAINHFPSGTHGVEATRLAKLKTDIAEAQKLASAATVQEAETILAGNANAASYLTNTAEEGLKAKGVDLEAAKANALKAAAKADTIKKLNDEIGAVLKVDKPGKADVEKFKKLVQANGDHLGDITVDAAQVAKFQAKAKFDPKAYVDAAKSAITSKAAAAEPLMKEALLQKAILASEPAEAAKKAAETALKNAEDGLGKIYGDEFGKAFTTQIKGEVQKAAPELAKEMHGHYPQYGHLGEEAATAAGKGRGFVAKIFLKSEEKLGEIAAKEGKAVSELGLINKLSKRKAGGIIAGAVALGYVAGVGRNPDKGKHVEQLAAQEAVPQQGLSVA